MEVQIEIRQTLCNGYLHTSLKSVNTMGVSSHCVTSGGLGSEKGLFLQSR